MKNDLALAAQLSNPRRPAFALPPGACDAHCHVFGPGDVFPYAPERRYTPEDAPKAALAALHGRLGISRAAIVQASCHGADNRAMLDCIASDPARYRGVAIIDASFNEAELKALHAGGARGARFNFVRHLGGAPDLGLFRDLVARIAPLGWHAVLHLDSPDIAPLSEMMAALPVPFVIDHMGRVPAVDGVAQMPFQALLALARHPGCWIKVSGAERISEPPFRAAVPFAAALIETAPERVLWGTDFPHPNLKHECEEAELVDLLPAFGGAAALQKLLVENPARLYGFDD